MSRLATALVIALAAAVLTTEPGLALAQQPPQDVCRVTVTSDGDPFPDGSELGVKVRCKDHPDVNFTKELEQGALHLTLAAKAKTKQQLTSNPLECSVEGPAFRNTTSFHCPGTSAPTFSLKPITWGVNLRAGQGSRLAPFVLTVDSEVRAVHNTTYLFDDAEVSRLLNGKALKVSVKTRDAAGTLESTFALRAEQYEPLDPSRQKLLPLAVERCTEQPVSYELTRHLTTSDLMQVPSSTLAQRKLEVRSPWPEQSGRAPRIGSMAAGVLEIVFPANHLCRPTEDGQPVRLSLELPELGRRLILARDGGVKADPAPRAAPRPTVPSAVRSSQRRIRFEGKVSGPSPTVMVRNGGKVTLLAESLFDITGGGEPELISLSQQIGRSCRDHAGILVCPIEDRADFTVSVLLEERPITAPPEHPMTLSLIPFNHQPETLEGADELGFADVEVRIRIDAWSEMGYPATFYLPGSLWRADAEIKTTLDLHIDKRALAMKKLALKSARLRDPVYFALWSHGWRPGTAWVRDRNLGRQDSVALIAEEHEKRNGRSIWKDYKDMVSLLALAPHRSADGDLLHSHAEAAAMYLWARTSSENPAVDFERACSKANAAWMKLPRNVALDAPVRLDLTLLRMQSCVCSKGKLTKQVVLDGIRALGPAIDKHPHYLEQFLDLKADLNRRTPSICQSVPAGQRRAAR